MSDAVMLFDVDDAVSRWAALRDICGRYWWSHWRHLHGPGRSLAMQLAEDVRDWRVDLLRDSPAYRRRVEARQIACFALKRSWHFATERRARAFCDRLWRAIERRAMTGGAG